MRRPVVCCAAILVAGAIACGGSSTPTAPAAPASTAAPIDPGKPGIVITWGMTGIYFLYSGAGANPLDAWDTLRMFGNFVKRLGEGRAPAGSMRIFYTSTRTTAVVTDPSQAAWNGPFLGVMAPLGAIDFGLPSRVDLSSYTVVVFDPCEIMRWTTERDVVRDYISRGGRALVLGDNFCWDGTIRSREFSNVLLADYGITFTGGDPYVKTPLAIPPAQQVGLLEGVSQVSMFRVSPQTISGQAIAVVKNGSSVLSAMATFAPR